MIKPLARVVLGSLTAAFIAGCVEADTTAPPSASGTQQETSIDPTMLDDGRAIAQEQCSGCHAVGPEGTSPNPRAPVFRTVLSRYDRSVLARELVDGMSVAHAPMPDFKLDPKGVDALIAYLQSIQVASPGRMLVEEKCARCHAIGRGDTSPYPGAQPFRRLGARWSRDQLRDALRTGIIAEHDRSGVRLQMKLSDSEITDLLDFLTSIESEDQPAPR